MQHFQSDNDQYIYLYYRGVYWNLYAEGGGDIHLENQIFHSLRGGGRGTCVQLLHALNKYKDLSVLCIRSTQ